MVRKNMFNSALVNDISKVKFTLNNINWDFFPAGSTNYDQISPFNCRKYHWLPATFVAEIPFTLIEVLSSPRAVVYDPFGGIGTTFFQALLLNRIPYTTEVCKVSTDFIKSLFILFDPKTDFEKLRVSFDTILKNYDRKTKYLEKISSDTQFQKLNPWFHSETLNQLSYLYLENEYCDDKSLKALFHISISSSLKRASSQDRGYGCIADNVVPKAEQIKEKDALLLFRNHANNLIKEIESQLSKIGSNFLECYEEIQELNPIIHHDVRMNSSINDESIDLIVTSPPYPNMVDYVKSQRLSYYFFDYDINDDLKYEIGARYKRAKHDALVSYLEDMNTVNENIANKLKNGGYICYVMPSFDTDKQNNIDRRKIVRNVMDNLNNLGLQEELTLERIIPTRRRLHNVKWATLEKEKISIYRKRG
jgi:DNA modification methylase